MSECHAHLLHQLASSRCGLFRSKYPRHAGSLLARLYTYVCLRPREAASLHARIAAGMPNCSRTFPLQVTFRSAIRVPQVTDTYSLTGHGGSEGPPRRLPMLLSSRQWAPYHSRSIPRNGDCSRPDTPLEPEPPEPRPPHGWSIACYPEASAPSRHG